MQALAKIHAARRALTTAGDAVEAVRQAIRRLEAERQAVASAPVPLAEAVEAVDRTIDRLAGATGFLCVDSILTPAQRGQPASLDVHTLRPGAVVGFLTQVLRPALRAALLAQLDDAYRDLVVGLPADARAERLAAIDRQLLELGRQEEQLITELTGLGLDVERRGDADVRAVLGIVE